MLCWGPWHGREQRAQFNTVVDFTLVQPCRDPHRTQLLPSTPTTCQVWTQCSTHDLPCFAPPTLANFAFCEVGEVWDQGTAVLGPPAVTLTFAQ
jgi:hypothetical protein